MKKTKLQELASSLGRMGGTATYKRHGKKHYSEMAKKRWKNAK